MITRILYITSTLKRTGPNNVMLTLISELDRSSFEPIVLTLSNDDPKFPSLADDFSVIGVQIISMSMSRIKGFFSGTERIKKLVNELNIQAIHIYGFRGDILIKKSNFKGIKIISTINSNLYDDYTMLYGNLKGRVMAWLHVKALRNKQAVGCSRFVATQLNKKYGISLRVINNGISKNNYTVPSALEKLKARKQLNLPQDRLIFVFVGYLIYRKDPITTIKAFLDSDLGEKAILIIVGDGDLMSECKKLANNNKNILFFGNQPQTLAFLKASDYYISSAYSEGLPTSVMEALGCGLPVLLSDIDPHTELVEDSLNDQFLFEKNAPNQLTQKMKNILDTPYESLSFSARSIIENRVNSELMAQQYQDLYI